MFSGFPFSPFHMCVCVHRHRKDGNGCWDYPAITLYAAHEGRGSSVRPRLSDMVDAAKPLDRVLCAHLRARRAGSFRAHSMHMSSLVSGKPPILHVEGLFLSSNSSSNASPSEDAPLTGSGSAPHPFPKFQHPSYELLKENGFTQQVYYKYRRRCLSGKTPVLGLVVLTLQ